MAPDFIRGRVQHALDFAAEPLERGGGNDAFGSPTNAHQEINPRVGPGRGHRAGDVTVTEGNDARPNFSQFGNKVTRPRPINNHDCELVDGFTEPLAERTDIFGGGGSDVNCPTASRSHGNFVHVEARTGVKHRASFRHGNNGDGTISSQCSERGAINGVDGNIHGRCLPIANSLTVKQHRGLIFFALTNNDDAIHRYSTKDKTHGVNGRSVRSILVASTDPLRRSQGGGFGDAHHFEREVPIGVGGALHMASVALTVVGGLLETGNTCHVTSVVLRPVGPLHGTVSAYGAKNAVLKQMAACLVASGVHTLTNVPDITDVAIMAELLTSLGCVVDAARPHELRITVPESSDLRPAAPAHLFEAMRASIVVLGPLLARCGEATMALPGGDDFGHRPINFHTDGLSAMGAVFENDRNFIRARSAGRLRATHITLEYPSHTATDNLLMAAVLADGRSVLENAAREPEVEDLGRQLQAMGAQIEGLGTSRLIVTGVERLSPATHHVVTDRIVTATYLAAALITGGDVRVRDAHPEHMVMLLRKIAAMGGIVDTDGEGIRVTGPVQLTAVDVATLPYPGVATDYKPLITTMLSVANGVSMVTENLFVGRFRYVDELVKLGARITTEGHHAMIRGVANLEGTAVQGSDIRAAAALVLAGLVATGETTVSGMEHVQRGYDDLVGRLCSLGAAISPITP